MNLDYFKILFFKLTLERFPNIFRPTSSPYISGDGFRKISDHIFDESCTLDPKKIKFNDIVFLNPELADIYFSNFHNQVSNKYYLVTHNSNIEIGKYIEKYIDEKIIHWFALNLDLNHPKATLIPYGLENLRRLRYGRKEWFKSKKFLKSENYVLASFDIFKNYDEREPILEILKNNKLVNFNKFSSKREYFYNLKSFKFLICPRGQGYDTSRIWEALLCGVYPILKLNEHSKILKEIGLPAIYLEDWNDLNNYDKQAFNDFYTKFKNSKEFNLNSFTHWKEKFKLLKSSY